MKYIIKAAPRSKQIIADDVILAGSEYIEPFFSFEEALDLYYKNTYHRRCILLKTGLLSQISETNLDRFLPPGMNPKIFLKAFATNLEIYGNGFIEQAGVKSNPALFLVPSIEARVNAQRKIFQLPFYGQAIEMKGHHLAYYSPRSRFYGEPDYLATVTQMQTENKIHRYNNAFFENNARPDMAISFEGSEPSDEQLEAFRVFFSNSFKGPENAHKTLIISAPASIDSSTKPTVKIEPLNQIEDMSFEKLKQVNRDEIIAAHNVPPRMVGVVASGSLGGSGEVIGQLHTFNETEIKPKIELLEWFFESIGVVLKLKAIDVSNFKEDADVVTGLVQTGILTVQEAKDILGWQKNVL